MSIRARIEDGIALYAAGRAEGALLSVLVAVAATSRRRRPLKTPSRRKPGKEMLDGEAFEAFLGEEMVNVCRVQNYNIHFRGKMHRLEHVLYKWLRCELAHAGTLPRDVTFVRTEPSTVRMVKLDPATGLTLSHGWLDGLVDVVVRSPENRDQFGDPPALPMPLYLPGFDVTVGHPAPSREVGGEIDSTQPPSG